MAIILLALQVNEFLQMQTVYKGRKAIGIKLERVPSLSVAILQNIMAVVKDKSVGALNVPRNFLQSGTKEVCQNISNKYLQSFQSRLNKRSAHYYLMIPCLLILWIFLRLRDTKSGRN